MPFLEESYDIAVVGAGHAGCEADPLEKNMLLQDIPGCPGYIRHNGPVLSY